MYIDIENKIVGKLKVLGSDAIQEHHNTRSIHWICQCDCGNIKSINSRVLRNSNHQKSCGNCVSFQINHNVFDEIQLPEAFILGLYYADGCVWNNQIIHISLTNSHTLIKELCDFWNFTGTIYINKKHGAEKFQFNSPKIFNEMSKYGIVPRKTYEHDDFTFLNEFDNDTLISWLYGLFVGDGNVTIGKSNKITSIRIAGSTTMFNLYKYLCNRFDKKWFSWYQYSNGNCTLAFLKTARDEFVPKWLNYDFTIGLPHKTDKLKKHYIV